MYHEDIAQKVTVFQKKIEEAYSEFYGNQRTDSSDGI